MPRRRVPVGRGGDVHPSYWAAATALLVALLLRVPLGQPAASVAATIVFIGGGLPHGAYDIALLRRTVSLDLRETGLVVGVYVTIALLMAALWLTMPLLALVLFLGVAAVHFGADWQMLEEPVLRCAAGAAIIAAATIGHPTEVAAVFVAMSDDRAVLVARIITAAAPVTLLVTAVGIGVSWRDGSRQWAAAMTICLLLLLLLPPLAGFALFFVFLHSPRHLTQTRALLRDMTSLRWLATGLSLSGAAIGGWWTLHQLAAWPGDGNWTAQAFQLLASVAVPHLLLSHWLENRLDRGAASTNLIAGPAIP